MSAIVLFTPNRTKIVHSDVIIMEQVNFKINSNFSQKSQQTKYNIFDNFFFYSSEFVLLFIEAIFGEYLSRL